MVLPHFACGRQRCILLNSPADRILAKHILESAKHRGHGTYWNQDRRRQGNHGNAPSQLRAPGKMLAVVTSGVRDSGLLPSDRGRVADDPSMMDRKLIIPCT